ncbi:MAG: hypothetical protein K0S09_1079 [Sphingobacteriaceae bacterium]|nr:hypothetical protein [Sphingobacteriaceae bacterium]
MKNRFLFPHHLKYLGYLLLLFLIYLSRFIVFSIPDLYKRAIQVHNFRDLTGTILLLLVILGLSLIAFSREKIEDEFISSLRSKSSKWALIFNILALAISVLFLNIVPLLTFLVSLPFLGVLFFIIHFRALLLLSKLNINVF